jgi:hypothetical protein
MKLNGSHKFQASSLQVFHAILNPGIVVAPSEIRSNNEGH